MKVGPVQFAFLRDLLRRRTGVVIDSSKEYLVIARLMPIARQRRIAGLDALIDQVRRGLDASLERDVLSAMMTHETSFFRDRTPFETLRKLIPELVARRGVQKQLTIWSAACSTGQEPYSIAMLLNEHFRGLLDSWRVRILATDYSEGALERARAGVYNRLETSRGLPPEMLARYFRPLQGQWSIAQECRRLVEFRCQNLNAAWPLMPPLDVVLIRNVMIYFDPQTRAALVERIRKVMRPDGCLFLGSAETLIGLENAYERVPGIGCSWYRPKPRA